MKTTGLHDTRTSRRPRSRASVPTRAWRVGLALTCILTVGDARTSSLGHAAGLQLGFSEPVNVSNTEGLSELPVLGHDGERPYVAWEEPWDNVIMLSRSDDGGATFTAPGTLVPNEGMSFGQVHLASLGPADVRMIFTAFDLYSGAAEVAYAVSTDAAQTFPRLDILSAIDEYNSFAPDIATGWGLATVWSDVQLWTGVSSIEVAVSTDQGATFSSPLPIDAAFFRVTCPSVALAPSASVFVAWVELADPFVGDSTEDILFSRSTDGGVTFSPPINLSNQPPKSWCPRVAADASGHVYVLWVEGVLSDKRLLLAVSGDGGETFAEPRTIAGPIDDLDATMSLSPDGVLWLAWMQAEFAGTNIQQFVSRSIDGGAHFPPPAALPGPRVSRELYPLVAPSRDQVFVAWTQLPPDGTATSADVFVSRGDVLACADGNEDGVLSAADALVALRAAVGAGACALCRCDTDGSGSVSAPDALTIMRGAVGAPVSLACVPC